MFYLCLTYTSTRPINLTCFFFIQTRPYLWLQAVSWNWISRSMHFLLVICGSSIELWFCYSYNSGSSTRGSRTSKVAGHLQFFLSCGFFCTFWYIQFAILFYFSFFVACAFLLFVFNFLCWFFVFVHTLEFCFAWFRFGCAVFCLLWAN